MRVVLASASPRRRDLLAGLLPQFEWMPADLDEAPLAGETPADCAARIALEKARAVRTIFFAEQEANADDALVIGADTLIDLDGRILARPGDAADAERMLRALAGRSHLVRTGLALLYGSLERAWIETTRVTFDPVPERAIHAYIATGAPFDRAGAYGIQDPFGARFIRSIDGEYNNVVGLPLAALGRVLGELFDS